MGRLGAMEGPEGVRNPRPGMGLHATCFTPIDLLKTLHLLLKYK